MFTRKSRDLRERGRELERASECAMTTLPTKRGKVAGYGRSEPQGESQFVYIGCFPASKESTAPLLSSSSSSSSSRYEQNTQGHNSPLMRF